MHFQTLPKLSIHSCSLLQISRVDDQWLKEKGVATENPIEDSILGKKLKHFRAMSKLKNLAHKVSFKKLKQTNDGYKGLG